MCTLISLLARRGFSVQQPSPFADAISILHTPVCYFFFFNIPSIDTYSCARTHAHAPSPDNFWAHCRFAPLFCSQKGTTLEGLDPQKTLLRRTFTCTSNRPLAGQMRLTLGLFKRVGAVNVRTGTTRHYLNSDTSTSKQASRDS